MNRIHKIYEKEEFKVYGSGAITETADAAARRSGLEREVVQSLMDLYGARYKDVLKLVEKDPSLKEKVSVNPLVIKAQLVYAVETEMARTLDDITDRRLSLTFRGPVSAQTLAAISGVLPKK
jgi:glycerol-3-phosphate dehydrogenase